MAAEVQEQAEAAVEESAQLRRLIALQQDEIDERGSLDRRGSRSSIANVLPLSSELEALRSPAVTTQRRPLSTPAARYSQMASTRTSPSVGSPPAVTSPTAAELRADADRMERQLAKQNETIEALLAENRRLLERRPVAPRAAPVPAVSPPGRKQSKVTIRVKRDVATYGHGLKREVNLLGTTEENVRRDLLLLLLLLLWAGVVVVRMCVCVYMCVRAWVRPCVSPSPLPSPIVVDWLDDIPPTRLT